MATIILELERNTESDRFVARDICDAYLYRAFQVSFSRSFAPPDCWTFVFKECNMSFIDSFKEKIEAITSMHACKYNIRVVKNG